MQVEKLVQEVVYLMRTSSAPLEQLNKTFSLNCRYTIVSQVEPHILPFFYCPRGQPGAPELFRGGRGLRGGFFLSLAERFLKLDMQKWLSAGRSTGYTPDIASSLLLQLWFALRDCTSE